MPLRILFAAVLTISSVSLSELSRSSDAKTLDYVSALENEIVREVNLARSNPEQYASFLEEWKEYYKGTRIERSGQPTILTEEGIVAVEEAIHFLRSVRSTPPLSLSVGMSLGAKDHVKELGPAGAIGHKGLYGSWPTDRVNRYGRWREAMGENIQYGRDKAREVVTALIIDDGVPSRAHRHNIFDPAFRVIGVGCGPHATYKTMCVITFAGGYMDKAR
ncbi:MAG: CAP domain-containing protein [Acidiferrobacterales bacterium]